MKRHLWNEQQAQSHSHSQMSVSKEQHEHPVGVQPRHHREPAEKSINRKDPVHHCIKGNIWNPVEHKQTHKKRLLILWRGKTKWSVPQPRNTNLKNRGIKAKLGAGFSKSNSISEPVGVMVFATTPVSSQYFLCFTLPSCLLWFPCVCL